MTWREALLELADVVESLRLGLSMEAASRICDLSEAITKMSEQRELVHGLLINIRDDIRNGARP